MLNPDFKDILCCFDNASVDVIVVGAYALAVHGYVRATADIDLWISNTPDNCQRVLTALNAFGSPTSQITVDILTAENSVLEIGTAPSRIDILSGIDGVTFAEAWPRATRAEVDGVHIRALSKRDLLTNKLAINRDKDLSDIAWLKKHM